MKKDCNTCQHAFCAINKEPCESCLGLMATGPWKHWEPITEPTCKWQQDEDGNYNTSCGETFTLIDGRSGDSGMNYCCYCGKRLEVEE